MITTNVTYHVIIFDTDIKDCLRNWYKTCSELRL